MTPHRLVPILILALLLPAVPAAADTVERRGWEPSVEGEITGLDEAGVSLRSSGGAQHFVPWDRVRRVVDDRIDPRLGRYLDRAEILWRARSRLERGDAALAEPLFERMFEVYRGQSHETALVVAEGLLRCRLARRNAGAVVPALETSRIRRAGVTTGSYAMLPAVIDAETGLCPQLPPVWINSRGLVKLERDLVAYDAATDPFVTAMRNLYLEAVRGAMGGGSGDDVAAALPEAIRDQPGVLLLRRFIACSSPDAEARRAARAVLAGALDDLPPWAADWAHFAIGASLLRERGVGRRQRGLVHLLHVPARSARTLPYLAGLALAWVAEASRRDGDTVTQAVVQSELTHRFPNHPVHTVADAVRLPERDDPTRNDKG